MKLPLASFVNVMLFVAVATHAEEPKAQSSSDAPSAKPDQSKEGLPQFDSEGAMLAPKDYL